MLEPRERWRMVLDDLDKIQASGTYSVDRFLSGWFRGQDPRLLKLENLHSFIAGVMFDRPWVGPSQEPSPATSSAPLGPPVGLTNEERDEVRRMATDFQQRFQCRFEEGYNTDLGEALLFRFDPLAPKILHRPLSLYVILSFIPRLAVGLVRS